MRIPVGDEGTYILDTGAWRTYRPIIDQELCNNCGICLIYCPVNSVKQVNKEIVLDLSFCKGCGICRQECPRKAISWQKEVR